MNSDAAVCIIDYLSREPHRLIRSGVQGSEGDRFNLGCAREAGDEEWSRGSDAGVASVARARHQPMFVLTRGSGYCAKTPNVGATHIRRRNRVDGKSESLITWRAEAIGFPLPQGALAPRLTPIRIKTLLAAARGSKPRRVRGKASRRRNDLSRRVNSVEGAWWMIAPRRVCHRDG